MRNKSLLEIFKENSYDFSLNGFILTYLTSQEINPLAEIMIDDNTAKFLDMDYILGRSGEKLISLFSQYYLDKNDNDISLFIKDLSNIIITKFKDKWIKLFHTLINDINPLENVSITEHKEINTKLKTESNANTFGFNTDSEDGIPESKIGATSEGNKEDNFYDMSRSGRDGMKSLKDLTLDELEILNHNLYNIIYKDIDSIVCLHIFK